MVRIWYAEAVRELRESADELEERGRGDGDGDGVDQASHSRA